LSAGLQSDCPQCSVPHWLPCVVLSLNPPPAVFGC
jgi:hypothetical protein